MFEVHCRLPSNSPFHEIYEQLNERELRGLYYLFEEKKKAPKYVYMQEVQDFISGLDPKIQEEFRRYNAKIEELEKEREERAKHLSHETQAVYNDMVKILRNDQISEEEQVQSVRKYAAHLEPAIIDELKSAGIIVPCDE